MKHAPPPPVQQRHSLKWLEQQLQELARQCPYTRNNPAECPLCGVRKLDTESIATWLHALEREEKEYLILYHQCCLVIRWENEHRRLPGRAAGKP